MDLKDLKQDLKQEVTQVKRTLVANWKQAYKWLSVQASVVFATVALCWQLLSADQQDKMLQWIGLPPGTMVAIGFALVVVGRLKNQNLGGPEA